MLDDFQKNSLILRDQLAVARTHMANERTLMAYIRSALMIFAGGVSLMKIYDNTTIFYFGLALLPLAAGLTIFSIVRFVQMRCRIKRDCAGLE